MAVIVEGVRTPFVKAFNEFTGLDTIDLGRITVSELLKRNNNIAQEVESVIWGGVVIPSLTTNIAREISLDSGLPPTVDAQTVSRACTSSMLSVTQAVSAIERGEFNVVIAGGSDSVSNAEVPLPRKLIRTFAPLVMGGKAAVSDYFSAMASLAPFTGLLPQMPRVVERSTGQLMGEAADEMCKRNGISREAQDELALKSHLSAAKSIALGRFKDEIVPVETGKGRGVYTDTIVRGNVSYESLAKLRPAFHKWGTITAGNASALTDGASATLIMSYKKAKELGYKPRARVSSWHYSGVDPSDQLLIGPAISIPKALERANLIIDDIDIVDIHEAFTGQVLCVLKAMSSGDFVRRHVGAKAEPIEIDQNKLNVLGGSVAIGHPFAATGARIINTMANEIGSGTAQRALVGICAAGGLGGSVVLEKVYDD